MKFPCEEVRWYLLPAIRRELASFLSEKKLSRKEIARLLGLTEAAVCQYLRSKRGQKLRLGSKALKKIEKIGTKMLESRGKKERKDALLVTGICELCKALRSEGVLR